MKKYRGRKSRDTAPLSCRSRHHRAWCLLRLLYECTYGDVRVMHQLRAFHVHTLALPLQDSKECIGKATLYWSAPLNVLQRTCLVADGICYLSGCRRNLQPIWLQKEFATCLIAEGICYLSGCRWKLLHVWLQVEVVTCLVADGSCYMSGCRWKLWHVWLQMEVATCLAEDGSCYMSARWWKIPLTD